MLSTQSYAPSESGAAIGGQPQPRRMSRGRVLIVEEDRRLLETYSDVLLAQGYDVAAARTIAAGVRELRSRGSIFDAVLTEAAGSGGGELLRAAREAGPGVPLVLVTDAASAETAAQTIEEEGLYHLVRPVSDEQILRCIDHVTWQRRVVGAGGEAGHRLGLAERPFESRAELEGTFTRAMRLLYMTYQPIIRTRDHSVFGWEALLRTKEPTVAGAPAFLDLAERLGRTRELGRAVRDAVASVAARTRGPMFSVNLLLEDLLDESLYDPEAALSARAPDVVLEITERRSLDGVPDIRDRVARLRRLGFRVAIDDLGAGHSNLTSLTLLEPDYVKLDRALVAGLDRETVKRRLVASLVSFSRELGMVVIAEGVEAEAERSVLAEMGCDLMQGFFFCAPEELPLGGRFPLVASG